MKTILALLAALAISGCSTIQTATSTVDMTDPSKAAYAAKVTYDASLVLATQYAKLPRCGAPTSPPLCSDRAVLDTMLKLSDAANKATQGAEDAVRSLGAKPSLVRVAIEGAQKSVDVFKQVAQTYAGGK
jgi:uncharacterized protein YceK